MEPIKNIFKNKDPKLLFNIFTGLALGIALLVAGNLFSNKGKRAVINAPIITEAPETLGYEQELEARLEDILSQVDGAGNVKVMVKISTGREIIVSEDISRDITQTKENDSEGGSRETVSEKHDAKTVIINESGLNRPLILKEIEPKIEGIIIITEGGDNIEIQNSLTKAAQTILGVEPHKVQVLKMKGAE